jgi:ABC-type spermidine/putrescine transport system permease subunit II
MRRTIDPSVNAVATILLVVPWVAVLIFLLAQRRRARGAVEGPIGDIARVA